MSTVGHSGALRRLGNCHPKASEAKAVALVAVTSTSLYCGKRGLERGTNYLLALFGSRLLILRPTRQPDPDGVLVDFVKGSYRVTDVETGRLNASFLLSRPYGSVHLRMLRWGWYSMNDEVLERLVAAAAQAERTAARAPAAPLQTAGEVRVFARMCAAYGPGAEKATAVAEVEVTASTAKWGLATRKPSLLLAAFPDRLVLLDGSATTHAGSTPVAQFARGTASVALVARAPKHLDVALGGAGQELTVRVSLYGEDRIDSQVVDAVLAVGSGSGHSSR